MVYGSRRAVKRVGGGILRDRGWRAYAPLGVGAGWSEVLRPAKNLRPQISVSRSLREKPLRRFAASQAAPALAGRSGGTAPREDAVTTGAPRGVEGDVGEDSVGSGAHGPGGLHSRGSRPEARRNFSGAGGYQCWCWRTGALVEAARCRRRFCAWRRRAVGSGRDRGARLPGARAAPDRREPLPPDPPGGRPAARGVRRRPGGSEPVGRHLRGHLRQRGRRARALRAGEVGGTQARPPLRAVAAGGREGPRAGRRLVPALRGLGGALRAGRPRGEEHRVHPGRHHGDAGAAVRIPDDHRVGRLELHPHRGRRGPRGELAGRVGLDGLLLGRGARRGHRGRGAVSPRAALPARYHLERGGGQRRREMNVLISGATGLIGSALVPELEANGHTITRLSRSRSGANTVRWHPSAGTIEGDLEGTKAVVHLAGESIAQGRWSPDKKRRILDSRVQGTRLVAERIAALSTPPKVLISTSAVGYYGDRGDEVLTEESTPGEDFLARVCRG